MCPDPGTRSVRDWENASPGKPALTLFSRVHLNRPEHSMFFFCSPQAGEVDEGKWGSHQDPKFRSHPWFCWTNLHNYLTLWAWQPTKTHIARVVVWRCAGELSSIREVKGTLQGTQLFASSPCVTGARGLPKPLLATSEKVGTWTVRINPRIWSETHLGQTFVKSV
jgi:hypothetical protein